MGFQEEERVDRPLCLPLVGYPKISVTHWEVLSDRHLYLFARVCACVLGRLKEVSEPPELGLLRVLFKNSLCSQLLSHFSSLYF